MCQAIFDSLKHVILLNQAILNRNRHCSSTRVTLMCESTKVEYSQNTVLGCVYCTLSLVSNGYETFKLRKLLRAYTGKTYFFSRLGRYQSGHVMLGPFSQSLYSTVLDEKSNNLLPFLIRRASFLIWATSTELLLCYCHKNGNFLYRCIEFNVPRTNMNIKIAVRRCLQHKI